MSALIEQGIKTIRIFGFRMLLSRMYKFALFKLHRWMTPIDKENIQKFESLHNKYIGKRIFIVGNGPSLNNLPMYLLKDEYTMCFNHFHLMNERNNWIPNFYCVTDCLVIPDMANELNEKIIPEVEYAFFPDRHPSNIDYQKYVNKRKNVLWLHADKPGFHDNLPNCGINESVVNAGIQVASYLGFSEIYVIGVDLTFNDNKQNVAKSNTRDWKAEEDDPNHFDPRYFDKGKSYHYTSDKAQHECFKQAYSFITNKGQQIFNAGYGGKLEAFPRVDFCDVLSVGKQTQEKMLLDAVNATQQIAKVKNISDLEDRDDVIVMTTKEGVNKVKTLILTHIPFGPLGDKYYFVKRIKAIEKV